MRPTPSDVHVNVPLTNISIAYTQDQTAFIADQVFPVVPVTKQSDRYYTYEPGAWNRDDMQMRAPATESAGSDYTVDSTPTYYCNEWALHKDVPDQAVANSDSMINPFRDATNFLSLKALIRRERNFAATFFKTGVWGTDRTGVASGTPNSSQFLRWDASGSDPVQDVSKATTDILEATGIAPNTLAIGKRAYDALKNNASIIDRIKYGQMAGSPAVVTLNILAQLFEIDRVLVMKAISNTAQEGAAKSHSFIFGKAALLVHSAPNPGLMVPTGGYTFAWNALGYAGQMIREFYRPEIKATRVEIETNFDQKLVGSDLGLFFTAAVS